MNETTELSPASPTRKTDELVMTTTNIDGVTGFPYETPGVRKKLLENLQEAVDHQALVEQLGPCLRPGIWGKLIIRGNETFWVFFHKP